MDELTFEDLIDKASTLPYPAQVRELCALYATLRLRLFKAEEQLEATIRRIVSRMEAGDD